MLKVSFVIDFATLEKERELACFVAGLGTAADVSGSTVPSSAAGCDGAASAGSSGIAGFLWTRALAPGFALPAAFDEDAPQVSQCTSAAQF